ncbi:MAG: AI-2E family transporter [Thermoleophilia bacterium]
MDGQPSAAAEGPPPPRGAESAGRGGSPPHDDGGVTLGLTPSLRLLLSLAAAAVVLIFMRFAASVINPLLLALVITMAVSPLLHRLVRRGLPLWLAWLITVVVTLVVVAAVVAAALIGVAHLIAEIPTYQAQLAARWQHATDALSNLGISASGLTQGSSSPLAPERVVSFTVSVLNTVKHAASLGLLTLLLVLFMLGEATTISLRFASTPPRVSASLARLEDFTRDMRRFVQATTITGLIEGVAVTVLLWVIGVHYAPLWGLLAFFMAFIPTLGALLAMAPPAFLALLEQGWLQAISVAVGILLIYVIIGNAVGRRLVAHHTNLSPLAVVISVVVWGWVLGLLGGLLAVPMTLLVRRLFIEAYDESGWATALLGRPHRDR